MWNFREVQKWNFFVILATLAKLVEVVEKEDWTNPNWLENQLEADIFLFTVTVTGIA